MDVLCRVCFSTVPSYQTLEQSAEFLTGGHIAICSKMPVSQAKGPFREQQ
jgi:hypothetical protein